MLPRVDTADRSCEATPTRPRVEILRRDHWSLCISGLPVLFGHLNPSQYQNPKQDRHFPAFRAV